MKRVICMCFCTLIMLTACSSLDSSEDENPKESQTWEQESIVESEEQPAGNDSENAQNKETVEEPTKPYIELPEDIF